MLSALGFRFLDSDGHPLEGKGCNLSRIYSVDSSSVPEVLSECRFTVACDVDTPFCGPVGASVVFAPQKGADSGMVAELDRGMKSFASVTESFSGRKIADVAGSGAAGGMGGAFLAFLGAELKRGVDMVLDAIGFDEALKGCDLVITGEGWMDRQTTMGKTPSGVLGRALKQDVPVVAIAGGVEDVSILNEAGFAAVFPVVSGPVTLGEAMDKVVAYKNVVRTVSQVVRLMKVFGNKTLE